MGAVMLPDQDQLVVGDCRDVMEMMPDNSVDSIVTDPPYGLSFMGREWDHAVPGAEFWEAALRVAKPGAHLVAFGGTRLYHRLTCAIEDAGWEIRDCLSWMYGSGFPKSLDVSKAIDKAAKAEREVVGRYRPPNGQEWNLAQAENADTDAAPGTFTASGRRTLDVTAPATDAARQWEGWGTALKPAWEPIILARKPLGQTVAANVLEHGTGALNIDVSRIAAEGRPARIGLGDDTPGKNTYGSNGPGGGSRAVGTTDQGRWPANVVLDEEAAAMLDAQTGKRGASAPASGPTHTGRSKSGSRAGHFNGMGDRTPAFYGDSGGASRFFYCAKASRSEREAGLDAFAPVRRTDGRERDIENPRLRTSPVKNHHPTVKPISLMRWVSRLVTPPNGIILDPFMGSGSTGCAAVLEGFRFVGIDLDPEYVEIARGRIEHWRAQRAA